MSAHPHDPTYNITKLFEIEGAFNVAEVKKAMDCAARGISALKTNFINCGEYYLQQYEEERKPELLVEDKLDAFEVIKYCERILKTLNILPLPTRKEWELYLKDKPQFIDCRGDHYSMMDNSEYAKELARQFMVACK